MTQLIALVAFNFLIHVLTWGNNTFSHIKNHFQLSNLFLCMPFMSSGCCFINLCRMHMGKSVEKACSALTVSEETTSISELKVECENQKSLWKRDIYMKRG